MNVNPIGVKVSNYMTNNQPNKMRKEGIVEEPTKQDSFEKSANVAFKGDKGAAMGIFGGALAGAALAALTVATGGLAAVVAAVGSTGTIVGGAAAGTHIGGIIGGLASDD
jgi:hypothetical protein